MLAKYHIWMVEIEPCSKKHRTAAPSFQAAKIQTESNRMEDIAPVITSDTPSLCNEEMFRDTKG